MPLTTRVFNFEILNRSELTAPFLSPKLFYFVLSEIPGKMLIERKVGKKGSDGKIRLLNFLDINYHPNVLKLSMSASIHRCLGWV